MLKSQTAELLTIAAAVDPIPVTELTVEAWHEVLGECDYAAIREALVHHRRNSSEVVRPAHLLEIIRRNVGALPRPRAKWEADD